MLTSTLALAPALVTETAPALRQYRCAREAWADRGWQDRAEIRERLSWLAVGACLEL